MIAQLTGSVTGLEEGRCIVDVNGVGYLVHASHPHPRRRCQPRRPSPACWSRRRCGRTRSRSTVSPTPAEREWFRLLTTVQGVGAKVALGVLSALSPKDLVAAIAAGDRSSLTRAPGVGPKLATRLLSELASKIGAMPTSSLPMVAAPVGIESDALSALANLGYRRVEAHPVVTRVRDRLGEGAGLDAVIRDSLKELAR